MIKKSVSIVIILTLNLFLFCGCWNYAEIDQQANVSGLAVDVGRNGKKYHVTVEIISMEGGDGKEGVQTSLVEADGDTILESVRRMISITSKKLYFGHCKVIVFSKAVAEEGIIPVVDTVIRDHEMRLTMDIVVSKSQTALEILKQKTIMNPIASYEIDEMLTSNESSLSESYKCEVYQMINILESDGISPVTPALDVITTIDDGDTFKLSGIAVFNKDKLIGFLNEEDAKIFLFIKDEIKSGTISVQADKEANHFISTEIYKNKTKVKPEKVNGELVININTESVVVPEEFKHENITREGFISIYNAQLEQKIKNLIQKVQSEFGVDIFGFGNIMHQKNNGLWKEYKDNWVKTFPTVKVNVKSKVDIRGSGTTYKTIKIGES